MAVYRILEKDLATGEVRVLATAHTEFYAKKWHDDLIKASKPETFGYKIEVVEQ